MLSNSNLLNSIMRFSRLSEVSCHRQGKLLSYSDVNPFRTLMLWRHTADLGHGRLCLQLGMQVTISAKQEEPAGNEDTDKADSHRPWSQKSSRDTRRQRVTGKSSLSHNTHEAGFMVPFASSFTLSEALGPRRNRNWSCYGYRVSLKNKTNKHFLVLLMVKMQPHKELI